MVNGTSAYAKRMNESGREWVGCEVDVDLADALTALAAKRNMKRNALVRAMWYEHVNANGYALTAKDKETQLQVAQQEAAKAQREAQELREKIARLEAMVPVSPGVIANAQTGKIEAK